MEAEVGAYAGYCNHQKHLICVSKLESTKDKADRKNIQKKTIPHEVIHAFLYESGLGYDSCQTNGGWAVNEEMVDWFAYQSKKINKVYKKLGV